MTVKLAKAIIKARSVLKAQYTKSPPPVITFVDSSFFGEIYAIYAVQVPNIQSIDYIDLSIEDLIPVGGSVEFELIENIIESEEFYNLVLKPINTPVYLSSEFGLSGLPDLEFEGSQYRIHVQENVPDVPEFEASSMSVRPIDINVVILSGIGLPELVHTDQLGEAQYRIHIQEEVPRIPEFEASSISIKPIDTPVFLASEIGDLDIPDFGDRQFEGSEYRIHIQEEVPRIPEFEASSISIRPIDVFVFTLSGIRLPDIAYVDQLGEAQYRLHIQGDVPRIPEFEASSISIKPIDIPIFLSTEIGDLSIPSFGDRQFEGSEYRLHVQEQISTDFDFEASSISIKPIDITTFVLSSIGLPSLSQIDQLGDNQYRLHIQGDMSVEHQFDIQGSAIRNIELPVFILGEIGSVEIAPPNQFGESADRLNLGEEFEYVEDEISGIGISGIEILVGILPEDGPENFEIKIEGIGISTADLYIGIFDIAPPDLEPTYQDLLEIDSKILTTGKSIDTSVTAPDEPPDPEEYQSLPNITQEILTSGESGYE